MVAWPPQVTMLTFCCPRCSSRFTVGTTYGPTAAGVRSTTRTPCSRYIGAWVRCAYADVASKTRSGNSFWDRSQGTPSADVSMPSSRARRRPSLAGSTPTTDRRSSRSERRILNIRSVPIFPEPTTETVNDDTYGTSSRDVADDQADFRRRRDLRKS
jgi:hypothetical protein